VRPSNDNESERHSRQSDWRCRLQSKSERLRHHRILVVDDHEDAREFLAVMLGMGGHEVETASDGVEALQVAERLRPDIIFLDIQMPKLSGIEVCKALRQKPWARTTCIYAVTGLDRAEDYMRSRLSGFDGHLLKPVDPTMINHLVEHAPIRPWAREQRPD
jgi:CheY-like chemotaxis protein